MPRFEFVEKLPGRARPALSHVLQALTNAFVFVRLRGNIQQPLVDCRLLHNRRELSSHWCSQNTRHLRLSRILHGC